MAGHTRTLIALRVYHVALPPLTDSYRRRKKAWLENAHRVAKDTTPKFPGRMPTLQERRVRAAETPPSVAQPKRHPIYTDRFRCAGCPGTSPSPPQRRDA